MKYYKLGNSDIEVSEVGFGCMSLELDKGQNHISDLLEKAHSAGINFFDTADLYNKGLNEQMIGTALQSFRDQVIIATKVGNEWRQDGSGWDWNPSKEHILTGLNESLRRLQTDYIDLYMLHGGTIDDPIDDAVEAFEQLKKQGKIRAYGISSIRPNTIREWIKRSNMDVVMMQYSLLDRRPEEKVLSLLDENDISVITRGTLAKGMLIDKPAKEHLGYSIEEVKKVQQVLQKTENPISASVNYVLRHPAVASAVLGIRTEEQLSSIVNTIKNDTGEEILGKLKNILKPNTYQDHR